MALTFSFALLASASASAGAFFKSPVVLTLSLIGYISSAIYLICHDTARKQVPLNYILLGTVTFCMATLIASFAATLTAASVVTAIMGCCFSTAGLFFAALYTSSRAHMVRSLATGLTIALIMDLVVLVIMLTTTAMHDKTMVAVISLIMCATSGIFIIFDLLYIILPGVADMDDYILAALNLYLDIARLFYYLLMLLGDKK